MTKALAKLNFRDLGGLPLTQGGRIKPGVIYRSEGPASFKEEHLAELTDLKIRLVCDLRTERERALAPNSWAADARLISLPVADDPDSETTKGFRALTPESSDREARAAMLANYALIPVALHGGINSFIDAILLGQLPVLVHCTAGKDRTGVLIAALLLFLGVAEQDVAADYLRSSIFHANLRKSPTLADSSGPGPAYRLSDSTVEILAGVDIAFLETALRTIDERWGSIANYFEAAGVSESAATSLRRLIAVGS